MARPLARPARVALPILVLLTTINAGLAADIVPPEVHMPGTQPNEVGNFESPDKCDNCHSGFNSADPGAEPATGWRGGAMGNAGRDPIFWATLAIAEQDFDGAGDLCIRCHSAAGWYGGRSTPTDGSGLAAGDDDGVDCDTCHASTNPDDTGTNPSTGMSLLGVMYSPFIANCNPDPDLPDKCSTTGSNGEGFYGSGMLSLWSQTNEKLGPFSDADARHQWQQSAWHRDPDFCGTCHDVSNPVVGDLALGHGAQPGNPHSVIASGAVGGATEGKAAFNNPPYAYGVVERTFSEYKSSPLHSMRVGLFDTLPSDLRVAGGSLAVTYQAAIAADDGVGDADGIEGDYADETPRTFSCQSCHMRPTTGAGANKNGVPIRADLPRHDHTGANYWFASMTRYQDTQGTLRLGGGLSSMQLAAMDLGQERATQHLREAASLTVNGDIVRITNLTGHKLITGYPEGRRMWLNIKWYDNTDKLIREDGAYGSLRVDLDGDGQHNETVETILDLSGTNTVIYEAHYAVTKEWAATIEALHGPGFVLSYDRVTGEPDCTVGQFLEDATPECSGEHHETFHFVLNNLVAKDNRIPPYQMSYTEAQKRNALPVPDTRYPRSGDAYVHWDEVQLSPPADAAFGTIDLLYQGTSWEYIQFLQKANNGQNVFLGQEGNNMLAAWLNADVVKSTGEPVDGVLQVNGDYKMVPPVVMASAEWGTPPTPTCEVTEQSEVSCADGIDNDCDLLIDDADPDCSVATVDCSEYDEATCNDNKSSCRWSRKDNLCLTK